MSNGSRVAERIREGGGCPRGLTSLRKVHDLQAEEDLATVIFSKMLLAMLGSQVEWMRAFLSIRVDVRIPCCSNDRLQVWLPRW